MRSTSTGFREWFLIFILFALVATVVLSPLYSNDAIPDILDYINHIIAIAQAKLALSQGQFPLRVMPLENSGMSYPYYQFYSPTGYLLAALVYFCTPGNPFIALKIMLWLAMLVGGIYMYLLALWFVPSKPAALFAGVVYVTSPYYIIVADHLGALNEAIALGMLPAAVYYSMCLYFYPRQLKYFLLTSLTWSLLATTHIITFFYTSLFCGMLLLWGTVIKRQYFANILVVGGAYFFSCFLSLWYFAPVEMTKSLLNIDNVYGKSDLFGIYSTSFATLISPWQNSVKAEIASNGMVDAIMQFQPSIGIALLFGVGVCLYLICLPLKNHLNKSVDYWLLPLLGIFIIAFVMVWSPLNFWHVLPRVLMVGQYSWRIMSQIIWIGAILFAWSVAWLFKNELNLRHVILGTFLLILSTSVWMYLPEGKLKKIPVTRIAKEPTLIWNIDSFLINIKNNKNLIDVIASKAVDLSSIQHKLQLNTVYDFPASLLSGTVAPAIVLKGGRISSEFNASPKSIKVIINGKVITQFKLKSGLFTLNIPLSQAVAATDKKFSFLLQVQGDAKQSLIAVNEMVIDGFQQAASIITLEQMKHFCQRENGKTLCEIKSFAKPHLLELPILYYPHLLDIRLNGKPVKYFSVLNQKDLVAGIYTQPGVINIVSMRFAGLGWANTISCLGFIVWGLLFVWMNTEAFLVKKFIFNNENMFI